MAAYTYPLLSVFWTLLWFFCFVLFIWLFVVVVIDVFRSHDMGGWGKAGWLIFLIVLPLIGILVYLIARGGSMQERRVAEMRQQERELRSYVQDVAQSSSADELAKLADLRARGVLTEEEFQAQKAKILA
ncbi:MAG TPA: SHOCT domain-containing protein [Acidimicrobiales bacterium]|nr:SHOCT domain-containing protein [Acidimicrobiales bacterium]